MKLSSILLTVLYVLLVLTANSQNKIVPHPTYLEFITPKTTNTPYYYRVIIPVPFTNIIKPTGNIETVWQYVAKNNIVPYNGNKYVYVTSATSVSLTANTAYEVWLSPECFWTPPSTNSFPCRYENPLIYKITTNSCCSSANEAIPPKPSIIGGDCKSIKVSIPYFCGDTYYLDLYRMNGSSKVYYYQGYPCGKGGEFTLIPPVSVGTFPSGDYYCVTRSSYTLCSTQAQGLSSFSAPSTKYTISTPSPYAGANITIPKCSTYVTLAATPLTNGYWTIESPAGGGGASITNLPNSNVSGLTLANATFNLGTSSSYVLHWNSPCGQYSSITITAEFVCGGTWTDARDSKTYKTILMNTTAGKKCWFAQNLNYSDVSSILDFSTSSTYPGTGHYYKYCLFNSETNCTNYGGLYLGATSTLTNITTGSLSPPNGLCDNCWHVSTENDWVNLLNAYPSVDIAMPALQATSGFNFANYNSNTGYTIDGYVFTNWEPNELGIYSPPETCDDYSVRCFQWGFRGYGWLNNTSQTSFITSTPSTLNSSKTRFLTLSYYPNWNWLNHVSNKNDALSVRCVRN